MSNLSTSTTKLSNKKFKISVLWGPFEPLKMMVLKTRHVLVLQVTQTSKNSIFSRINRFDLKSFLYFRATHAPRFYTLSIVGGLQIKFLVSFKGVCLYIFIPVGTPKFSQTLVYLSKRVPEHPNFCICQTSQLAQQN
jgi:hypothetical protein